MVQKGDEDDLRPGKSIPRYRTPTSAAVLSSRAIGSIPHPARKLTLFKVNFTSLR